VRGLEFKLEFLCGSLGGGGLGFGPIPARAMLQQKNPQPPPLTYKKVQFQKSIQSMGRQYEFQEKILPPWDNPRCLPKGF